MDFEKSSTKTLVHCVWTVSKPPSTGTVPCQRSSTFAILSLSLATSTIGYIFHPNLKILLYRLSKNLVQSPQKPWYIVSELCLVPCPSSSTFNTLSLSLATPTIGYIFHPNFKNLLYVFFQNNLKMCAIPQKTWDIESKVDLGSF